MGYVSVGHLLSWIFPEHMAFKNIVYSLYYILITTSTDNGILSLLTQATKLLFLPKDVV
jgi:hypothetical protein